MNHGDSHTLFVSLRICVAYEKDDLHKLFKFSNHEEIMDGKFYASQFVNRTKVSREEWNGYVGLFQRLLNNNQDPLDYFDSLRVVTGTNSDDLRITNTGK